MKATTHTEVYRPYTGELRPPRWSFVPIASSGIRVALKSRWPLLLYLPAAIATVIFGFIVYAKFSLEQGMTPGALAGPNEQASAGVVLVGTMASKMIEVRDMIVGAIFALGLFSVLLVAWYGAGLVCEDRRVGAHLLYFSRPLSLANYVLGKLCVVGAFVLASVLVPALVICTVAISSSPGWTFLEDQGWILLHVALYSLVHTFVLASLVLAISTLASRRIFALIGTVGFFLFTQVLGMLLAFLQKDARWMALGPLANLRRVAATIFGVERVAGFRLNWDPALSWWALAGVLLAAWTVIVLRVKRMESLA
ncbi:MAG: hypothetical protein HZA53_12650 [Planctomycetes bacterium]|nr:hypothetical protein [Planctomycetota bacterium]